MKMITTTTTASSSCNNSNGGNNNNIISNGDDDEAVNEEDGETEIEITETADDNNGGLIMHNDKQQQHRSSSSSLRGILYMILGAFSFSLMFLTVKLMASTNTFTLVFYRSFIQCIIALSVLLWKYYFQQREGNNNNNNPPLPQPPQQQQLSLQEVILGPSESCSETRFFLTMRGLWGAAAICAFYYGIQSLPLPDAVTLQFTTPPFAAAFAVCIVNEKWRWLDMLGAVVCFMGVALIAHPTWLFGSTSITNSTTNDGEEAAVVDNGNDNKNVAVLVTTSGAAMAGLAYVCVRRIGHKAPAMVMVLYDGALCIPMVLIGSGVIEGTVQVWSFDRNLSVSDYVLILMMGITAFGGQWFTNIGLQEETAATATLATTTQIVWTYIFELLFLSEPLNLWSVAGTGLILGYMLLVAAIKINGGGGAAAASTILDSSSTESEKLELVTLPATSKGLNGSERDTASQLQDLHDENNNHDSSSSNSGALTRIGQAMIARRDSSEYQVVSVSSDNNDEEITTPDLT